MDRLSHKQMEDPSQEEIISLVNSIFEVDNFTKTEFSLEFKIQDTDFKTKFEDLSRKLEGIRYAGKLEKREEQILVIIQKFPAKKHRKWMNTKWTPRILFAVVISFVMIDGYYRTEEFNSIVFIGDPLEMAVIYTISLLGILGIHELGHLIASRHHKLKTTWPFFIPGIPMIPSFTTFALLPTFGAIIQSRGHMINRSILFDVAIAGPIAGLVIAIIVSLYGAYTLPIIEQNDLQRFSEEGGEIRWFPFGNPLLFQFALAVFGKTAHFMFYTPVLWASWIGFLITFLNLLPAAQLDGGHMARTLFGRKGHKYATYVSLGILVLLNFWFFAFLIIILSWRNLSAEPLDDISPISRKKKLAYLGVIGLTILCAPLPVNLLA